MITLSVSFMNGAAISALRGSASEPTVLAAWPDATNTGFEARTLTDNPITQLVPGTTYTNQNFTHTAGLTFEAGSGDVFLDHCKFTADDDTVACIDTNGFTGKLTIGYCEAEGTGLSSNQTGNMCFWNRSSCTMEIYCSYLHEFGQPININGATGVNKIHDNFIDHLLGGASTHYEILYYGGNGGAGFSLDIEHNTFINENVQTAAIFIENEFGPVSNITINNNQLQILGGGDWPIAIDGHNSADNAMSDVTITNNILTIASGSQFFNIRGPGTQDWTNITNLVMTNNTSAVSGDTIWSPEETYALNQQIEGWDGWLYKSTLANNIGNAQPNSGGSQTGWTSSGGPGFVG